jgi:hypothetical protein
VSPGIIRNSSTDSVRALPSGATNVAALNGSAVPSARRSRYTMSSVVSDSWSASQSQPTTPAESALVLHSRSSQLVPVTRTVPAGSRTVPRVGMRVSE